MSFTPPVLHLMCGKIAAGKSTLSTTLGTTPGTIVVREDHWLSRLYPGEQNNLGEYLRNSSRLRDAIAPHLVDLLRNGLSVVLDFPANTRASRAWMRALIDMAACDHLLHHLDVSDTVCQARLRHRNASGAHEFEVSDADFALFTSYFTPPSADEGFKVLIHRP